MSVGEKAANRGIIARYRDRINLPPQASPISLGEGDTPLVPAPRLAADIGFDGELYLKFDGNNPTGSFKDRGMAIAITAAAHEGAQAVICASTGNTSASAAAYAARAEIPAFVIIPSGKIALGKLSQAISHGAKIVEIDGNFDVALQIVRQLGADADCTVVNSINPHRIEGQKTAAFEICDSLGDAPDYHFLPVGNAGNITAYWRGYTEYHSDALIGQTPHMMGIQASGAAPLVLGHTVENPETVATAIRIGQPASWEGAIAARDESDGRIDSVTDDQILHAYKQIASLEGVFAEPASAASIAGLAAAVRRGHITPGSTVVCTLTGHGLKDPAIAMDIATPPKRVAADVDQVRGVLWP